MRQQERSATYEQPVIAWPGVKNLRCTLPLSGFFVLIFYTFYGGASFLTGLHNFRLRVDFAFERSFPFVPQWAAVYLSLNVLLALAPFILRTRKAFLPLFLTMSAETVLAGLCFLLLPVELGYPETVVAGFWGGVFHLADVLNLDYNYLPSLHVALAFTAALAFGRRCGRVGRLLFFGWATAIAVSTLLIHEHHVLDVIAGIVLAVTAMQFVYPRAVAVSNSDHGWNLDWKGA